MGTSNSSTWTEKDAARFRSKLAEASSTDCLQFTGATNRKGYGKVSMRGVDWYAHRVAYTLAYGAIPKHAVVMHVCDNPGCCFIKHLLLGTIAENNADRAAKGRSAKGGKKR